MFIHLLRTKSDEIATTSGNKSKMLENFKSYYILLCSDTILKIYYVTNIGWQL